MESKDLSPAQLATILRTVARQRDYLNRLKTRLEQTGFVDGDPLLIATVRAWQYSEELTSVVGDLERLSRVSAQAGGRSPVPTRDRKARGS